MKFLLVSLNKAEKRENETLGTGNILKLVFKEENLQLEENFSLFLFMVKKVSRQIGEQQLQRNTPVQEQQLGIDNLRLCVFISTGTNAFLIFHMCMNICLLPLLLPFLQATILPHFTWQNQHFFTSYICTYVCMHAPTQISKFSFFK